uniref:hypothetical protein n=1 Tax=Nonomuraea rhizosphaerae TaxID=2665663 RepID=UPI001C5FA38E
MTSTDRHPVNAGPHANVPSWESSWARAPWGRLRRASRLDKVRWVIAYSSDSANILGGFGFL